MNNSYCKIPTMVKKNKSICSNAKLLYGDIQLLCHQNGYCYASNKFLAENLSVTDRTIRRLIKELKDANLIRIEYVDNHIRHIYLMV